MKPKTKKCSTCLKRRPIGKFWRRGRGDLNYQCCGCATKRAKKYRKKHPEVFIKHRQKAWARNRKMVNEAKNKPCADCDKHYPYYVMDLDHKPGTNKVEAVSRLASRTCKVSRLLDEIAKCEVVCANCHRERTFQREAARREKK